MIFPKACRPVWLLLIPAYSLSKQLIRLGSLLSLYYQDWPMESFTATEYDKRSCHNHPEFYPPDGRTSIWNNTLHFAGTETAGRFGGYLEGALVSARRAVAAVSG